MAKFKKQFGLSLMEILVVIAVIAILMGVSIPAAKQMTASLEKGTGTRQLINAALSNARAIAVREQAYAGVRFQKDKDGNACIIFIIYDKDATGFANGFRAVTGRNPIKLPENTSLSPNKFSIIFSPQGKLTIHDVRARNKDAKPDGDDSSTDTIFNTSANFDIGVSQFVQDPGGLLYNFPSVQQFTLNNEIEYINPYTGELVMEYREQNP